MARGAEDLEPHQGHPQKDLARKMEELERKQKEHGVQFAAVYSVVKQLIDPPPKPKRRIGFLTDGEREGE